MANDELVLYYQPKVCLLRGEVIGAEALVRWNNPNQKIIAPDVFLPLAASSGLLHDITINLLDQAVAACARIGQVQTGLSVSMNVAPNDLESHTISNRISYYLDNKDITAEDLQIEITEAAAMSDFDRVRDDLERLTTLGIKLLMDDFGTGYSSIDRLSQLPFSSLKLDQGVVRRMGTSTQNLNVVKSSISMARELRMTSVAEGIETAGAYNFLIANGCEEAQGFFIGRPMALDAFIDFIRQPHDFEGSQIGRIHQAVFNLLHHRKCLVDAAYCNKLDPATVLPSVIDPDISRSTETSRFGVWYYGMGQSLAEFESFVAIESPLRKLHACGEYFLSQLKSGADGKSLDQIILDFDLHIDSLLGLLHAVERELLFQVKRH